VQDCVLLLVQQLLAAASHGLVVQETRQHDSGALPRAGDAAQAAGAAAAAACAMHASSHQLLPVRLKAARRAAGDGDLLAHLRQRGQRLAAAVARLARAEALAQQRHAVWLDAAAIVVHRQGPAGDVGCDAHAARARLKAVQHELAGRSRQVWHLAVRAHGLRDMARQALYHRWVSCVARAARATAIAAACWPQACVRR
jgi:hypothetical protein